MGPAPFERSGGAFQGEELRLGLRAASVLAEAAAGAQDAVARHHDREGVGGERRAGRTHRVRAARSRGDVAVGGRLAVGDPLGGAQDVAAEAGRQAPVEGISKAGARGRSTRRAACASARASRARRAGRGATRAPRAAAGRRRSPRSGARCAPGHRAWRRRRSCRAASRGARRRRRSARRAPPHRRDLRGRAPRSRHRVRTPPRASARALCVRRFSCLVDARRRRNREIRSPLV